MLPFTRDQFFDLLRAYNHDWWAASPIAYVAGGLAVALVFRSGRMASAMVLLILAAMWAWTGLAYHGLSFTTINKAAYGFAALFVIGAAILVAFAVPTNCPSFAPVRGLRAVWGWLLIAYAAVLYPLIGLATGHDYGSLPQFGVTPCPVTLFTFGLLMFATPLPWPLLVAPVIWSLIGGSAAFLLDVPQDWPLLASGVATLAVLWFTRGGGPATSPPPRSYPRSS